MTTRPHEQFIIVTNSILIKTFNRVKHGRCPGHSASNVIRATFLSLIGKDCFNVFLNLDLKEDEKNSLPKIIEALNNHFTPLKNVIYERYIFNTSNQEENEGIDSCTNRLRGLASSCEYDILTEELIRDRIVLGIKDNRVRKNC
ncbi:K02A2.6-like [Cordylochernes scorpioides]|uniref:K02A2.6-like n=1 Tax=Cordylochernes scorpioides TaxID=51811 RepID=A0ABY6LV88_9ARAC|nr:K02A2.6-like [Cordylochernes scorpioides]